MAWKSSRVDKNHIRKTSPDGRKSILIEETGLFSSKVVEHAEHFKNGTTVAYEDTWKTLSGKGKKKS